jgi:hypothetical protein
MAYGAEVDRPYQLKRNKRNKGPMSVFRVSDAWGPGQSLVVLGIFEIVPPSILGCAWTSDTLPHLFGGDRWKFPMFPPSLKTAT